VVPKTDAEWHTKYFAHVFNLPVFRRALAATCSGVKVRHTSPDKIYAVQVPVPPTLSEQARIASVLDENSELALKLGESYRAKLTDLAELRQSLLGMALAGQLT
jgi:type I restriction enzyme S subunit